MKHAARRGSTATIVSTTVFSTTVLALTFLALLFANTVSGSPPVDSGKNDPSEGPLGSASEANNPVQASTLSSPKTGAYPAGKTVHVTIDALSNRHTISPYVYGVAYPNTAADITDSGATEVRWGGNSTSRYNWTAGTINTAADWYFGDYGYTEIGDSDSALPQSPGTVHVTAGGRMGSVILM